MAVPPPRMPPFRRERARAATRTAPRTNMTAHVRAPAASKPGLAAIRRKNERVCGDQTKGSQRGRPRGSAPRRDQMRALSARRPSLSPLVAARRGDAE
eukprot:4801441-Prymnesium_polylepis.1